MAIGPISALRPVSMMKRSPEDPDLSRVVEVEPIGRPEDDEYTSAERDASRGLGDAEAKAGSPTDLDTPKDGEAPVPTVSLFA